MQNGVVLVYSKDGSSGVIRTPDGKRLFFNRKQWMSATPPCAEQNVLFKNGPQGELQVYFEHDVRTKERAG